MQSNNSLSVPSNNLWLSKCGLGHVTFNIIVIFPGIFVDSVVSLRCKTSSAILVEALYALRDVRHGASLVLAFPCKA